MHPHLLNHQQLCVSDKDLGILMPEKNFHPFLLTTASSSVEPGAALCKRQRSGHTYAREEFSSILVDHRLDCEYHSMLANAPELQNAHAGDRGK